MYQENNRTELVAELAQTLEQEGDGALLHLSVDNLFMIITSHGATAAEDIITGVATKIEQLLTPRGKVMRTDIGHIHVIIAHCSHQELVKYVHQIIQLIRNYGCTYAAIPVQLVATVGAVECPATAKNPEDAIEKAYIALNDAKENMYPYKIYNDDMHHKQQFKNQLLLASYLQNAITTNKLCLAYQPVISRKTAKPSYYECLLRVRNEDHTLSSVGPFIPISEKMGFVDLIDSFVLEMVIEELHNQPDIKLAMNLSNLTICNDQWMEMAIHMLQGRNITKRLLFEITETAEQQEMEKITHFVTTMQKMGCEVALDDFGSGYTSFSQLKKIPVDIIKIDGSFVRDMTDNPESKFLVKMLIDIGRNFGIRTVAEFVENHAIAAALIGMKIDYMQGNYFSPASYRRPWLAS